MNQPLRAALAALGAAALVPASLMAQGNSLPTTPTIPGAPPAGSNLPNYSSLPPGIPGTPAYGTSLPAYGPLPGSVVGPLPFGPLPPGFMGPPRPGYSVPPYPPVPPNDAVWASPTPPTPRGSWWHGYMVPYEHQRVVYYPTWDTPFRHDPPGVFAPEVPQAAVPNWWKRRGQ